MDTEIARGLTRPNTASPRETASRALRRCAEKDGRGYPDWAVRYAPLVRRLKLNRPAAGRILEIGANENGLARFVRSGARIVAVDRVPDHLRAARAVQDVLPVVGDMAELPFADAAFDIVVAVDTLEHVRPERRPDSLREMSRVLSGSGRAGLSFPSGEAARDAEAVVARAYRDAAGRTLRWLDEHGEYGLPNADETIAMLGEHRGKTHRITTKANANLSVWRMMWKVLLGVWPRRGNAIAQVALRMLTPLLARAHWGACYRTIIYVEPRDE